MFTDFPPFQSRSEDWIREHWGPKLFLYLMAGWTPVRPAQMRLLHRVLRRRGVSKKANREPCLRQREDQLLRSLLEPFLQAAWKRFHSAAYCQACRSRRYRESVVLKVALLRERGEAAHFRCLPCRDL